MNIANFNRLTTLADAQSNSVTFGYDDANRLISKSMPNGITSSFQYDGMSRLKRLKHDDSGSAALYDDQYAYNSANQISQIAGLSQTRNFTYDKINRLTGMTNGTNTETYSYDAVGNRTMSGYTTGAFNRLTAANSQTYNYDANGSRYRKSDTDYGWDRENRLVSTTNWDAMHYNYDALGRRVSSHFVPFLVSTDDPPPTRFTYDGPDVILDDNSGQQTTSIVNYQNAPGIDNKLAMTNDGRPNYFLQDHLGSTVGLTDNGGNVAETNTYDSFGNPTNSSFPTRYQFTGREFDSFSGLQYSRARFYDPQIGRFISEDPIGFGGGDINLYSYVSNSPLMFLDPLGLDGIQFLPPGSVGNSTYQKIKSAFDSMKKNCACRTSFKGFGVDLDQLDRNGILVGSSDTLANPSISNSDLFMSQNERDQAIPHIKTARAFTATNSSADSRPHMFFNNSAYSNLWSPFSDPERNLRRNFAHELLHAGGIPGKQPGIWRPWSHDLSYLDNWLSWPYSNLIENCSD